MSKLPEYDGMDPRTFNALEAIARANNVSAGSRIGVLARWGYIERDAGGWRITEHGKQRLTMGRPVVTPMSPAQEPE